MISAQINQIGRRIRCEVNEFLYRLFGSSGGVVCNLCGYREGFEV